MTVTTASNFPLGNQVNVAATNEKKKAVYQEIKTKLDYGKGLSQTKTQQSHHHLPVLALIPLKCNITANSRWLSRSLGEGKVISVIGGYFIQVVL